jgi:CheY-like chemotaxis protein
LLQFLAVATGVRVLIVDDEADFRSSMAMLLALEGFQVAEASDGHAALHLLTSSPPAARADVVLLDFRMPGMNGGEVLVRLRAAGSRACVILVSAVADLRAVAARYGFDRAVPKPCDYDELRSAIDHCIGCVTSSP